jgi:decaprenylphospho-beta-D-erythro-pentofuranosid-2-ulose 2-reductase
VSALPWQRAIVVGASSGIGEALARHLAAGGCRVALVARRAAELARVRDAIVAAGGRADVHPHDVTRTDDVARVFAAACADLRGLDLVVYAAGIMPRIAPDEYGFAVDDAVVRVNLLGAMAWLDETAVRFAAARAGTIVGISSVAGDRGRRGNPAYHASKAALDTFLESLRNRVARLGVRVVTVKPGPVDTPMTKGMDRLPLLISADAAAAQLLAAAARGTNVAYVPATWRPIMFVLRNIPSAIFRYLEV